jgi:hypothetical protein
MGKFGNIFFNQEKNIRLYYYRIDSFRDEAGALRVISREDIEQLMGQTLALKATK